jgi:hypothetical protein
MSKKLNKYDNKIFTSSATILINELLNAGVSFRVNQELTISSSLNALIIDLKSSKSDMSPPYSLKVMEFSIKLKAVAGGLQLEGLKDLYITMEDYTSITKKEKSFKDFKPINYSKNYSINPFSCIYQGYNDINFINIIEDIKELIRLIKEEEAK